MGSRLIGLTEGERQELGRKVTLLEKDTLFVLQLKGLEWNRRGTRKGANTIEMRSGVFAFHRQNDELRSRFSAPNRSLFSTDKIAKQSTNK
jgi:hypothetical protein